MIKEKFEITFPPFSLKLFKLKKKAFQILKYVNLINSELTYQVFKFQNFFTLSTYFGTFKI